MPGGDGNVFQHVGHAPRTARTDGDREAVSIEQNILRIFGRRFSRGCKNGD